MHLLAVGQLAAGASIGLAVGFFARRLSIRRPLSLKIIGSAKFRPFRNVWMLEEMSEVRRIPYVHVPVRPRTEEARKTNPLGKIPTLMDGELVIYESVAINTFLGDRYRSWPGCSNLVPEPGTDLRGRYESLTCCMLAELDAQGLWIHRKHASEVAKFIGAPNEEAANVAREHVDKIVSMLAGELCGSDGEYLLGSNFSAADILFTNCLDWAEDIEWGSRWVSPATDDEPMQQLAAYAARCRARPAYLRAKAIA